MKKIILLVFLAVPSLAQAGLLGFLGDVSSISSAMRSGNGVVNDNEVKGVKS